MYFKYNLFQSFERLKLLMRTR